MKDILQDIVAHTNKLGFLNIVKITGTEDKTQIDSMSDNRSVIMQAETTAPIAEMIGTFGMPQLEKLRYLLDGKEYQDDAKIELVTASRNGETIPVGLHFENKDGDFKNDYRFMNQDIINEKIKSLKMKGLKWDVEINPSITSIQRFQFQAGANPEHETFLVKTDGDKLVFSFGNSVNHAGEFVFESGITGKLTKEWHWPVVPVLSILKIADANNTTMSFANAEGALQITLDSGIAIYKYIVPAKT